MDDIMKYLSIATQIAIAKDLWDALEHECLSSEPLGLLIDLLALFCEEEYNVYWVRDEDYGPCTLRLVVTMPGGGIPI